MAWTVDIDGTDITSLCQSIRWRNRLNAPDVGIVTLPGDLFQAPTGTSEMHIYQSGTLVFSGPLWYVQANGDPDVTTVELTAYSHLIWLTKRMCKTAAGNLITPESVLTSNIDAPSIMAAFISNVNTYDATRPNGSAMPLTVTSFDIGGDDVSGEPMDFPMTLEQMKSQLCATGQLNVLVSPGIGSSDLTLTNGGVVNDLTGSVSLDYGTGGYNSQIASATQDMEVLSNALWYLLGPRCSRTRWRGSITPTAPHDGASWPPDLVAKFMTSRTDFGYAQEIRVFDDIGGDCAQPNESLGQSIARPLFEEEWANEAWIRANPRFFGSIRPERGYDPAFRAGDMVTVTAGSQLYGGFTGAQVVFEMEVEIDADGVVSVTNIDASGDQNDAP